MARNKRKGESVREEETPRVRMFAGPNGSGKSTIKTLLRPELLGRYINPDDIEADIRAQGFFDFLAWDIPTDESKVRAFLGASSLLANAGLLEEAATLSFANGKLDFLNTTPNSYFASVLADFLRQKLLLERRSFTFETVMSAPDKVALLRRAKDAGFRTYLYFVATKSPKINVSRVANRVLAGGHGVPTDKILARYERCLNLLPLALEAANRAFVFDNSGAKLEWLAEFADGRLLELKTSSPPRWFQTHVLDNLKRDSEEGVRME